jgi:hypothetical protein
VIQITHGLCNGRKLDYLSDPQTKKPLPPSGNSGFGRLR